MRYLPLLILLGACAGGEVKKQSANTIDPTAGVVIKNQEFNRQKPLVYSPQQDYYPSPKDGAQTALQNESAARDLNRIQQLTGGKDPLVAMMTSCYAKNFEQAFKIAESVYDTHQNLPTYWNQVATCHLLQGNERKALLFYNKALEVTPQYVPALNNIGVMYEKNGQDQKALVALQRALKNGKYTKTPRFNLGHLFLSYNLADEALPLFRGLADEAPADVDVRAGLANSLAQLGRWQDAWDEFNRIPEKDRRRSDVGLTMALTAHRLGKSALAQDVFQATDVTDGDQSYAASIRRLLGE
jgi:tetratricopeptide (TPR) repeat protein